MSTCDTSVLNVDGARTLSQRGTLSSRPSELHHYTTLETAQKILELDNIRLSHAEYSNDQREMQEAKNVIEMRLNASALPTAFVQAVKAGFSSTAPKLDAYIFCMSSPLPSQLPQVL